MAEKKLYHRREFLNDDTGAAMLEIDFSLSDWKDDKKKRRFHYNGSANITDCSRSITLDFDFANKKDAEKALRKVMRLTGAFRELHAAMGDAYRKEFLKK